MGNIILWYIQCHTFSVLFIYTVSHILCTFYIYSATHSLYFLYIQCHTFSVLLIQCHTFSVLSRLPNWRFSSFGFSLGGRDHGLSTDQICHLLSHILHVLLRHMYLNTSSLVFPVLIGWWMLFENLFPNGSVVLMTCPLVSPGRPAVARWWGCGNRHAPDAQ